MPLQSNDDGDALEFEARMSEVADQVGGKSNE